MSERLDRIEAILEATAEQQQRNTEDIDTLLGAISTTDVEVRSLTQTVAASERRFENLRADAMADRQTFREQLEADRQRSDGRFNEAMSEIRAQGEILRSLLSELTSTNQRIDDLEEAS